MKALIKKLAAVIIAAAAMLGLAGLGAATANAADTGTGTITVNTVQGFTGELTLYQMFSATVDTGNTDDSGNVSVAYTLKDEWKTFFTSGDADAAGTKFDTNATDLSQQAVTYIQGLSDTALATFANRAVDWAQKANSGITGTPSAGATNAKTYTFTGLAQGYYLIAPDAGQKNNTVDGTYHALLVNLTSDNDGKENASIQLKHEFPTIDKTVDNKPAEDKNIGDTVNYKLSSTVAANMMDYTEGYTFTFHDTLSKGLTLLGSDGNAATKDTFAPTVTLKGDTAADDVVLTKGTHYTVTMVPGDGNTTKITVAMQDIQNWTKDGTKLNAAGKTITVEYSAKINADAATGTAGNANSAQIEYSNDPSNNQTGTSVPTEVKVHTFEFTLDKYTGNIYNESSQRLGGAKFKVYADKDGAADTTAALKFHVTEGNGSTATTARYDSDQTGQGMVDELVTPEYGRIVLTGLDAGTYWVEETEAPKGYNKLTEKIKVTISATYDTDDGTLGGATTQGGTGKLVSWKITYALGNATGTDGTGEHPVVPVKNINGLTLPSTGSIGTMLFTVLGVLIVVFGAVWYVKSNRKSAKHV